MLAADDADGHRVFSSNFNIIQSGVRMQIWQHVPLWNDGTEVRVVGVADVLIEAGRDAGAMSLLIDAQEVSILFFTAVFFKVSETEAFEEAFDLTKP
jgi:hypothetical protein